MIVTCPNCSTNFKVPEAALGTRGRSMKCARCDHVWHAAPEPAVTSAFDEIPLESPPPNPRGGLDHDEIAERMMAEPDMSPDDMTLADMDALGFGGEGTGSYESVEDEGDPFAEMSDLMMARQPESMPDVFSMPKPKPPTRRRGGLIIWSLSLLLLLAATVAGLDFFMDRLIDHWPKLEKYYDMAGIHRVNVGVGLVFRNYSAERTVQDNNEVLIVRGVVENGTERRHEIPHLRLALYNGDVLLQEKIVEAPQPTLEPHATVGFRVTLDQPDVNASRFEVTFAAPIPAGK